MGHTAVILRSSPEHSPGVTWAQLILYSRQQPNLEQQALQNTQLFPHVPLTYVLKQVSGGRGRMSEDI